MSNEELLKSYRRAKDEKVKEGLLEQLVNQNKAVIRKIAKINSFGDTDEDSMQNGIVGLLYAVKTYKASKKVLFSTWAYQQIRNEVQQGSLNFNQREKEIKMQIELNPQISVEELVEILGRKYKRPDAFTREYVQSVMLKQVCSLQSIIREDGLTLGETIPDNNFSWSDFEDGLDLERLLGSLPQFERDLMTMSCLEGRTNAYVGKALKVNPDNVGKMKAEILLKLQRMVN